MFNDQQLSFVANFLNKAIAWSHPASSLEIHESLRRRRYWT